MPAKAVQISIEASLLARIDRDPQTKREGRSAFVADAVRLYLSAKRRRATDEALAKAFGGRKNAVLDEVESMLEGQAWPRT
jgi:metal-responsive CopG/Arc/MetJ family transcriptional regulator